MITWEAVALGLLSICTAGAGWFLKELTAEVRRLSTCVSKQSERWIAHDLRHSELREDRKNSDKDIWGAISDLRKAGQ